MKKILDILYNNKNNKEEQKPKAITIKLKSTVTPDEKVDFNTWASNINTLSNKLFKSIG